MSISNVSRVDVGASITGLDRGTAARTPKQTLGSEDFMKILAVQFQAQDPMKPMEDTAFIAQMAQFSALEQSNSLVQQMTLLRAEQQQLTAAGYLGRSVTVENGDGEPVTGEVTAIDNSGAAPALVIGGANYPLSSVRRIEPAVVQPPTPTAPETEDAPPTA